ncbi:hypothetical protein BJ741DRAFT_598649 [Chytriomyces cf. hyalinus JEL632]|nr:hypothetical protein BJ741DRAFT_598649 [Chytriomyces cf. hyalinus JEL632]
MRLQTPTLLAALILAATGHASPAACHPQLSGRSIKRDGLTAPQSQTLKVGGAVLYVPVLTMALFAVGGLVYRKLFAKKDRPVPINTADPPLPDLQQISTSRDADSESIRSWIVHDLNSDDDEDHRRSSSLARPSIAITSSKYTRPSAMESPFSPTRKHIYPDPPSQRSSPKVKDFRVDVANVILDWPRSSERESSSPQQWRSPEQPSNWSSSGHANSNTNNAGDATRSVKSLDLKSVRSVGGGSVTQSHSHSHSLSTRAHSSASKQNTALGTMPGGLQEHLAPSESDPEFDSAAESPSSASQQQQQQQQQQHAAAAAAAAAALPPPVPSVPHIYTSRVTLPKDSPGLENPTDDVLANEVVQYMSTISLRKSSLESESGSSSSWYLDVKREDGELSPAPSSVFMDILGQNEECDV